METFFSAIANYGFPVVVAAYLLFRFEKRIENLEKCITGKDGLIDKVEDLKEVIVKCQK